MTPTTTHTPGPWQDGAERDGRITTHYVKAGTGNIYLNRGVGQTEAEARANIRLVAAAPDLLAACKAALSIWDGNPQMSRQDTITALRAAIARAEGETI